MIYSILRGVNFLLFFCCVTINYACKEKNTALSKNDELLKRYVRLTDSLAQSDTTDVNYKILKGLQKGDTVYLSKQTKNLEDEIKFINLDVDTNNCKIDRQLKDTSYDEVYKFISSYSSFIINYGKDELITIGVKKDSVKCSIQLHKLNRDLKKCYIGLDTSFYLKKEDWLIFKKSIIDSDFWGLRKNNFYDGFDGYMMYAIGYQKPQYLFGEFRYTYLYRWNGVSIKKTIAILKEILVKKYSIKMFQSSL